jgi:hypothetical protein
MLDGMLRFGMESDTACTSLLLLLGYSVPPVRSFYNNAEIVHRWLVSQLLLFCLPGGDFAVPAE